MTKNKEQAEQHDAIAFDIVSMTKDIKRVIIALDLYRDFVSNQLDDKTSDAVFDIINASKFEDVITFTKALEQLSCIMDDINDEHSSITGDGMYYLERLESDLY